MESQPQNPEFRNDPENFHSYGMVQDSWIKVAEECTSYDVASGSEITPCNTINKPL